MKNYKNCFNISVDGREVIDSLKTFVRIQVTGPVYKPGFVFDTSVYNTLLIFGESEVTSLYGIRVKDNEILLVPIGMRLPSEFYKELFIISHYIEETYKKTLIVAFPKKVFIPTLEDYNFVTYSIENLPYEAVLFKKNSVISSISSNISSNIPVPKFQFGTSQTPQNTNANNNPQIGFANNPWSTPNNNTFSNIPTQNPSPAFKTNTFSNNTNVFGNNAVNNPGKSFVSPGFGAGAFSTNNFGNTQKPTTFGQQNNNNTFGDNRATKNDSFSQNKNSWFGKVGNK